ncbi:MULTISPECIES: GMC family oxidoreductase [unclassified Paenibacillus]|uniref:GMC family oxidoreductase n=1 Tax=unclassified Paenibacillus TaxID=185978 RepID=UPI00114343C2|nr:MULTISPECIES: GMC family oxidoreductase [unclassified Paenibacillus]
MNRRYGDETVDVLIVGAGAAGGVLAKELSEAGMKVVVLESGPYRDPQHDFASDELAMQRLGWQDTRVVDGSDPLEMGHNNSGWGVGGGTTHFTGVFLRFHESDFQTRTLDGVGEDWPIRYADLKPYYEKIERDIAVSGPKYFPWGPFRGPYPYPERDPISPNAQVFARGCEKLGIGWTVTPLAILSAPFEDRPPCINRGFCNQGCMPNAKFSTLIVHIPKAEKAGAEVLADCTVTQVNMNATGRVTGVTFVHHGDTYEQKARIVVLATYVVETPRLLLNSANGQYPEGLANRSGWVGKAFMTHSSHDVYARFDDEVRLYKGTPVLASTQDFYSTSPDRDFARGYTLHAHGARPLGFAQGIAKSGGAGGPVWGNRLREAMLDYNYYGRVTLVGEVLPDEANRITLCEEKDVHGQPRAKVTFGYGENDRRLIRHAIGTMSAILEASGGRVEFIVPDTAHLMGGCRMGDNPETSVVNSYGQCHDIPNLFLCGANSFVTSGGGNPTNTVMALALRTADYIKQSGTRLELQ